MLLGSVSWKAEEWVDRLERYDVSGKTVAEFCRGEGVSQASFYLWRKRVRALPSGDVVSSSRFQPVQIVSSVLSVPRKQTVVHLGRGIQIELGSDLAVAEAVVRQLLLASQEGISGGGESC